MTKTIRSTYPRDMSVGMLIIIFVIVFFLSGQLFEKHQPELSGFLNIYVGEFLVSFASLVMVLILWEEILFPVKIRPMDDGLIYRNHRTKLRVQALMYLIIPAIIAFLYTTFEVNAFRFFAWAAVVLFLPVAGKLISGINNYNDFLTLTGSYIDYKDNEREGRIELKDISQLEIIRDEDGGLHQLKLSLKTKEPIIIELHQMELEAFFESIEEYIRKNYGKLLTEG